MKKFSSNKVEKTAEIMNEEASESASDNESITDSDSDASISDIDENKTLEQSKNVSLKRKNKENGIGSTKAKNPKNELYKQPTVEELNQLRETENLFHSNLFRLQIEEMLQEVKVKPKYEILFNAWFSSFQNVVVGFKNGKLHEITDQKWLRSVTMPLVQRPFDVEGVFKFLKPVSVDIVASFKHKTCVGPNVNVDVVVVMPSKSFQKHDFANERYHRKRALYLCHLAQKLLKTDLCDTLEFIEQMGQPRKPLLKITPSGKLNKYISVFLHVACEDGSFKLSKFNPSRSNIRQHWFFDDGSADDFNMATSLYNFSVLQDLTLASNEEFLVQTFEHQHMKDALVLLKVWLRQRELDVGYGGFSGHVMAMVLAFLMQSRRINTAMSSYQIVRNVWTYLAASEWHKKGITLYKKPVTESQPSMEEFHANYQVVLVDVTGYMNVCSGLSLDVYMRVATESSRAVHCLDNSKVNSFQVLFMKNMTFYKQYDHIINIHDISALEQLVNDYGSRKLKLDHGGCVYPLALKLITDVLRKGMASRVRSITPKLVPSAVWPINEAPSQLVKPVVLGLSLDPIEALSVLDKGPPANLPEAEAFRSFWGPKSELRRFQDGSISEACVWANQKATMGRRRAICKDIVLYLLQQKFRLAEDSVLYISDQLESVLQLQTLRPSDFEYGLEEASLQVINAFDSLGKQLRGLSDLALEVNSVQGISSVFRYCDAFPTLATTHRANGKLTKEGDSSILFRVGCDMTSIPRYVKPNNAVIQLGLSGKWPDSLPAVRRIKAAFYIQISQQLHAQFGVASQVYPEYMDVLKDGFIFRLSVVHQKEISLIKQQTSADGMVQYRDNECSAALERRMMLLPKLTSALHGLHHQHSSFGSAVSLAKRWLCSHLLDDSFIPSEVVELLVSSLYVNPEPYLVPTQPQVGFLRFLDLVGHTDWSTEAVIININSEMTRENIFDVETQFTKNRSTLPPLFIVTPYDTVQSVWTRKSPSLQVLVKIALLARQCLNAIENLYESDSLHFKAVFTPSLSGFDLLIHLKTKLNPFSFVSIHSYDCGGERNTEAHYKKMSVLSPYKKQNNEKVPVTGFNPVEYYLEELRSCYGEFALFFHDSWGGDVIAVLWKPTALEERDFKVSHFNGRKIKQLSGETKLITNFAAIIEDLCTLGQGLVKNIENLTHKDQVL